MRKIKFRGRRLDNGEWAYGYLYILPLPNVQAGTLILTDDYLEEFKHGTRDYDLAFHLWKDLFPVNHETIGQFTSLYDKNKKEIYEGDILKAGYEKMLLEVRFVRGVFSFLWNGNLDDEFPTGSPTHEWAEVVGNIHDNKELLKGD